MIVDDEQMVTVHVTLQDEAGVYEYDQQFGGRTVEQAVAMAEYQYAEGNYACDCNRSLFIGQYCDPDYPELDCGETISLVSLTHEGRALQVDREGLGDVFP